MISDTAQSKAVAATVATLRADGRRTRVQVVSIRRRATSSGPPEAIRRAIVQLTVGVTVAAGTQEIEGEL